MIDASPASRTLAVRCAPRSPPFDDTIVALATPPGRSRARARARLRARGARDDPRPRRAGPRRSRLPARRRALADVVDAAGRDDRPRARDVLPGARLRDGRGRRSRSRCTAAPSSSPRARRRSRAAGARLARPGEFTERAFLLGQARSRRGGGGPRADRRADAGGGARVRRGGSTARSPAELADVREDLAARGGGARRDDRLRRRRRRDVCRRRRRRADRGGRGRRSSGSLRAPSGAGSSRRARGVVLLGPPNAGQVDALQRARRAATRAIVTDVPGRRATRSTRAIDVEGVPVELVDTAGPARDRGRRRADRRRPRARGRRRGGRRPLRLRRRARAGPRRTRPRSREPPARARRSSSPTRSTSLPAAADRAGRRAAALRPRRRRRRDAALRSRISALLEPGPPAGVALARCSARRASATSVRRARGGRASALAALRARRVARVPRRARSTRRSTRWRISSARRRPRTSCAGSSPTFCIGK